MLQRPCFCHLMIASFVSTWIFSAEFIVLLWRLYSNALTCHCVHRETWRNVEISSKLCGVNWCVFIIDLLLAPNILLPLVLNATSVIFFHFWAAYNHTLQWWKVGQDGVACRPTICLQARVVLHHWKESDISCSEMRKKKFVVCNLKLYSYQ